MADETGHELRQVLTRWHGRCRRFAGTRDFHRSRCEVHQVSLDWPGNVFDLLRPKVLEGKAQLVEHLIAHHTTDTDATRFRQRLQPRGDIHAVTKDVVAVNDDVTDVDAHTKLDPLFWR